MPVCSGERYEVTRMAEHIRTAFATVTILRRKQVEARTGLSRSTIYAKMHPNPKRPGDYDPTFPKPVSLGVRAVGWVEAEIDAWLYAQVDKSRNSFSSTDRAIGCKAPVGELA